MHGTKVHGARVPKHHYRAPDILYIYIYIYIIFSLLELDCPKIEFQNKGISLISLRNGAKC